MAKVQSKKVLRANPSFEDIRKWYEKNLHPDTLDTEDEKVYKHVYDEGRWANIFQFQSSGAQKLIQKFHPRCINDISVATSVYRPGPLNAKVDKIYLENKKSVEKIKQKMHPLVWDCLKDTFGTIVFQEQLQILAHKVGGFSLDDTDQVRKVLLKRSMKEKDAAAIKAIKLGEQFVEGAVKNGLTESEAKKLWEDIKYFSGYGFNKSLYHNQQIIVIRNNKQLLTTISEVEIGDKLFSRDEKTNCCTIVKVLNKHDHGKQRLVEFKLETGETVRCTMAHKFRTSNGKMTRLFQIIKEQLDIVVDDAVSSLAINTPSKPQNT